MIPFFKMHGLGNDFVVLDAREKVLPTLNWRKLADRHFGVGCDQVVILEPSDKADVFMRIVNADGGEVDACGNASRCVAWVLHKKYSHIETLAGIIDAHIKDENHITIDMGQPHLEWDAIPLSEKTDTLHLPITCGELADPVAVSMGNPHMVFFVNDASAIKLEEVGPALEHHPFFPKRANVNIAQIVAKNKIILRVWERGAGLTLACGTGACATLVAANRRRLINREAEVQLPGGSLYIEWYGDTNHVLMTGPSVTSYKGTFDPEIYRL